MIPVYNLYLQDKALKKFRYHNSIDYKAFLKFVSEQHAPKDIARIIIKELELNGLIKVHGKNHDMTIDIINPKRCSILQHPAQIYHLLGAW